MFYYRLGKEASCSKSLQNHQCYSGQLTQETQQQLSRDRADPSPCMDHQDEDEHEDEDENEDEDGEEDEACFWN